MTTLPTELSSRHQLQARHNKGLLNENCFPNPCTTKVIPYLDWNITVSFYVALHYVQAYLAKNGFQTHFDSHKDRNDYLKNNASQMDSKIDKILADYLALYKLSKHYRYDPCAYYYQNQNLACKYRVFALQELPKKLGFIC